MKTVIYNIIAVCFCITSFSIPNIAHGYTTGILDNGEIQYLWPNLNPSRASINNQGQVVGSSQSQSTGRTHAFLWDNGRITDLGTLGGIYSQAYSINNNSQIAGWSRDSSDRKRAVMWNDSDIIDLHGSGTDSGSAYAINDNAQIVGYRKDTTAFLWENGNMVDINLPQNDSSQAKDINNVGQIIGHWWDGSEKHGFFWESGSVTDLGLVEPTAINNAGQVVGWIRNDPGEIRSSFIWENGTFKLLGQVGAGSSYAADINDLGQVLLNGVDEFGQAHAFLWENNNISDLGIIGVDQNSKAYELNNSGQVVFVGEQIPIPGESITVASPNGGEELSVGELNEIIWTSEGEIDFVKIEYSTNNGADWTEIVASTENVGPFNWEVPCDLSNESLIRISDVDSEVSDESDSVFSIIDDSAPSLTVSVEKDQLWPPRHKMIDVGFSSEVSDNCDTETDILISVTSDEPTETASDSGSKEHCPDAEINEIILLRAERSESGDGRVYVITVQATDDFGNASSESIPVKVNIDKKTEAIDSGQDYDATEIN